MVRVVFTTLVVTHYRQCFHELVRSKLQSHAISYDLITGAPTSADRKKGDTIDMPWATRVACLRFGRAGRLVWQNFLLHVRGADLVILGQENRFLANYCLQILPRRLRPRIALWGHGRNFQARRRRSWAERWKARWARRCDWWFAYTDETRRHLERLGYPPERITVFNNALDVLDIFAIKTRIGEARLAQLRADLGLSGDHVGVFVGGHYPDKRLEFLFDAADRIRAQVPDFELLIIGGGEDLPLVRALAAGRSWVHVMGPRFGAEKIELMLLAHLMLMPGLVGLAILDAGAAGLPLVTTAFPWHSPEIAYLEDGRNGVIVPAWRDPDAFADAVVALLGDPVRLARLGAGALVTSRRYTVEAMADRFVDGVLQALTMA